MPEATEHPYGGAHRCAIRVYWEDTDAGGIVYYANYLKFAERARSELVRDAGLDQAGLLSAHGVAFAVRRCEIDYRAPARLDDLLHVVTSIDDIGRASLAMGQEVLRGDALIVRLRVDLVCVNRDLQPVRLPPEVRASLNAWQARNGSATTSPAA